MFVFFLQILAEQFFLFPFELFHSTQHRLVRLVSVRMNRSLDVIYEIFLFVHVIR